MIKHTQTIRRQIADELFECVLPFCVIGMLKNKHIHRHVPTQLLQANILRPMIQKFGIDRFKENASTLFSFRDKRVIIFKSFKTVRRYPKKYCEIWYQNFKTPKYRKLQLWNLILDDTRSVPTLKLSKKKTKQWKFESCPCITFKT